MTANRLKAFWEEIDWIQKRHSVFFPASQKKFISIEQRAGEIKLKFLDGYNLSSVITQEIEFAFKLIDNKK